MSLATDSNGNPNPEGGGLAEDGGSNEDNAPSGEWTNGLDDGDEEAPVRRKRPAEELEEQEKTLTDRLAAKRLVIMRDQEKLRFEIAEEQALFATLETVRQNLVQARQMDEAVILDRMRKALNEMNPDAYHKELENLLVWIYKCKIENPSFISDRSPNGGKAGTKFHNGGVASLVYFSPGLEIPQLADFLDDIRSCVDTNDDPIGELSLKRVRPSKKFELFRLYLSL